MVQCKFLVLIMLNVRSDKSVVPGVSHFAAQRYIKYMQFFYIGFSAKMKSLRLYWTLVVLLSHHLNVDNIITKIP